MARIPDEEIDRLKRETDLAALVRSRGIELHKHGSKDFAGKCPFHQEDTASFIVTPDKGLFHCMGCGVAGNCIQFVEKFDGVSFRHAFELLNEGPAAFSAPGPSGDPLKRASVPRLELPFDPAATNVALLAQVVDYYHERLTKTSAALDYLRGRGLYHEEAVERFRLGFADRTLGLRLPEKNRKVGAEIRTRLQSLGLMRESGHEHFSGSVVLPIFTASGEVGEMYGRKITPNLRKGTPLHLYLQGPHEGIWNADALNAAGVDPVRSAVRRAHVLGERVQERDVHLRHGRLYRRAFRRDPGEEGPARPHRLRCRRRREPGGGPGRRAPGGARHRSLPRQVPLGHGRQRVRPEGHTGGEVIADGLERRRMGRRQAGPGTAADGGGCFTHTRACVFLFFYSCSVSC